MIFRRCLWLLLIALAGCATKPQPVTTPIDQIYFQSRANPSENLIVFLPGIGDEPKAFLDEGFVQAVRDRNIDADLVAVRAHWGYYEKHMVVERMHQDVIGRHFARRLGVVAIRQAARQRSRRHIIARAVSR